MDDRNLKSKIKYQEFIQAEKWIKQAEFDKALKLLHNFEKKSNIDNYDKFSCYYLKGKLLIWQGRYEEAIKTSQELFKLSQLFGYDLQSIDALILLTHIYAYRFEDDKALETIKKIENMLKKVSNVSPVLLFRRKAHLFYCQGIIDFHKDNLDRALGNLERSIALREEIGDKQDLAESFYTLGRFHAYNGKFDRALEYVERSLSLAKESKCMFYLGLSYNTLGTISMFKGKLDQGLMNFEKSLAIFKKIKNILVIGGLYNNMSIAYDLKGESRRALEYLEQSIAIDKTIDIERLKINTLDTAIQMALEINDVNRAQLFFQDLKKIKNQQEDEQINFIYLYNKALLLKSSSHKSDQIRSCEIFKELVEKEIAFNFEISVKVLLNLNDLLLAELQDSNNLELLDQIQVYINQILNIAKNQNLHGLLVESYLLEIKFDLIKLDWNNVREKLTEALKIAEKYDMKPLVKRLSIEQKNFVNQKNKWLKVKHSDKAMVQLANLTPMREQIRYMLKKRELLKANRF